MDIQWILVLDIYLVLNMINAGMKIAIYSLHQKKSICLRQSHVLKVGRDNLSGKKSEKN